MKQVFFLLAFFFLATTLSAQAPGKRIYKKQIKHHRSEYKSDFLKDERSPFHKKPKGLNKIKFYKPNLDYRCNCSFTLTPDAKPFLMATYSGKTRNYVQYGQLNCPLKGEEVKIAVYRNLMLIRMPQYKNHLFIPFKDFTNGEATYGGGRYIDIESTDIIDNQIIIDFNKCYNPWCAFSDGYNCPIPPKANHLELEIKAGERAYSK